MNELQKALAIYFKPQQKFEFKRYIVMEIFLRFRTVRGDNIIRIYKMILN